MHKIWICKVSAISGIITNRTNTRCTRSDSTHRGWPVGPGHVSCHVGSWLVKPIDQSRTVAARRLCAGDRRSGHFWTPAGCLPTRNRTRRHQWTLWWWCAQARVTGDGPASTYCGGKLRRTMNLSYEQVNEANKIPRDAQAHHEPYSLLGEVGEGREWAHGRGFWRASAEGNVKIHPIQDTSTRFLSYGDDWEHGGASELPLRARDGPHRRRPELGFPLPAEKSKRDGGGAVSRVSQRWNSFYKRRGAAASILGVDGDGRRPWRHRAAWLEVGDDILPGSFRWSGTGLLGQNWAG
jgi:hypothetical protein